MFLFFSYMIAVRTSMEIRLYLPYQWVNLLEVLSNLDDNFRKVVPSFSIVGVICFI